MKKIIIADDSAFMRKWLKTIIQKHDYSVIAEAANGLDAVSLYQKLCPDIIILDIIMPESNGLEALQKIKAFDSDANVIVVSSLSTKENVMLALQYGAKDFIVKPYFDGLIKALEKVTN